MCAHLTATAATAGVPAQAQDNYRIRQMKMIERARTVDRAAMFGMRRADGGWDDCPDKFILDMAGITSANSDDFRR